MDSQASHNLDRVVNHPAMGNHQARRESGNKLIPHTYILVLFSMRCLSKKQWGLTPFNVFHKVLFWRTASGRQPAREWLRQFDPAYRKRIGEDLYTRIIKLEIKLVFEDRAA